MRTLLVTVLILLAPASAQADRQARKLKQAAMAHYGEGRYAEAAREFRAAHALAPDRELLYALGQALRLCGDCAGAIAAYEEFLATSPPAKQAGAAREKIEVCRKELPEPQQSPPRPAPAPEATGGPAAHIQLGAGLEAPERPPPARRAWYRDVLGGALTGGGLVAAAAGTWLIVDARGALGAVERAETEEEFIDAKAAADRARGRHTAGIALVAIGAGMATGGVVRYLLLRRDRQGGSAALSASVAPDGAAILFTGGF